MAMKSVDEQPHLLVKNASSAGVNEMMVCQMRMAIRELWPDEFDVKPKLTIVKEQALALPAVGELISAREEAVYQYAKATLLEMLVEAKVLKPKLVLIQGGRES